MKHPPPVLERGLCDIDGLWQWYQAAARGRVQRRNGTIHLLDAFRTPVMHWDFKQAFPTKWTGPELRADANAVAPPIGGSLTTLNTEPAGGVAWNVMSTCQPWWR